MRVLYIDSVGQFGGASRSLYELVSRLKGLGVTPFFVTPHGSVEKYYGAVAEDAIYASGISRFHTSITGTYRGARWLILGREAWNLMPTLRSLRVAKSRWGSVDLIHVNEIADMPAGLYAKHVFGCPLVVHLRCCVNEDKRSRRIRLLHRLLRSRVDMVIPIDENTRATLPSDIRTEVVHNSFSPVYPQQWEKDWSRVLDSRRPLTVGFVGNIMKSKGIMELIAALAILKKTGRNVRLVVAGGRLRNMDGMKRRVLKFLNLEEDILPEVNEKIASENLSSLVDMRGHVDDISKIYDEIDVIAFPSYFDAPGRPIFEAAYFKVPSISCISHPRDDTVVPGGTGLTVPARDPAALADTIAHFEANRGEVRRMGEGAFLLATRNFDPVRNSARVLEIYRELTACEHTTDHTLDGYRVEI